MCLLVCDILYWFTAVICQLPIYGEPEPPEFERLPEWDTAFHRQVSRARKWTWSYLDSIQVATVLLYGIETADNGYGVTQS